MKGSTAIFYLLPLLVLFCLPDAGAQDLFYRSASNTQYWKNRRPHESYWQQDVHYVLKARVDDQTDIVDGEEELTYFNNSPDTLRFVYFHLYQNAFIKGSYLEQLNKANNFRQKFGKYEKEGKGTVVESLSVNGAATTITPDNTIMRVELPTPLLPGASTKFNIRFKTYFDDGGTQRRRMKMFKDKWGNKQYDGVHWYPRICVYDRKFGWETDQHLGKEFYGDFGSYDVELTFPAQYVMDATGVLQNREEVMPADLREKLDIKNFKDKPLEEKPSQITPTSGTKTWKFHADNVHDFAWVADPTFRIGETITTLSNGDRVSCIALAQEPHAARWQDASSFTAKVIDCYSRDIGNYVYPKMICADARDGMEYPMLTLDGGLSPGYYGLIAHEVGHNWFFGMVGNNETYRASLDEGFTQFLTSWSMTSIFGEERKRKRKGYVASHSTPLSQMDQSVYLGYVRDAMKHEDASLNTHSDDFGSALNHGGGYGHVYYKTATMLYNLQYVLGDELFLNAMKHYFSQWKMAHPYFEDFRSSIIGYTHVDLNWFFDQWMETTKTIDYSIEEVKKYKGSRAAGQSAPTHSIVFRRKGEMQMPLDVTVRTQDSAYRYLIPNSYFAKQGTATVLPAWKGWGKLNETYTANITLPAGSRIKYAEIDHSKRLADVYQLDNSTKCPILFSFDHQIRNPMDRKHYILKWRPEIWYNSVDGIKAGLHFNGNYMNYRHVFSATVWYNTGLGKDYKGNPPHPVNFNVTYRSGIVKDYYFHFNMRGLDGLRGGRVGFEKVNEKRGIYVYFKSLYRKDTADLDYLLYRDQWNPGLRNNSANVEMERNYSNASRSGKISEGVRASLFSDYDYSKFWVTWINHENLWRFELHSRIHGTVIRGSKIAPESQLYLASGNSEEMMDNKFIRSRGFVPTDWLGYGNTYNHFHFAGGLNVRGYAGYLVPVNSDNSQFYLFGGQEGGAVNLELDFDKLVSITPGALSKYFHFDTYLFGDAGMIQTEFKAGTNGLTSDKVLKTRVLASAGAGVCFTIKKWGVLDDPRPLTLRFDMPLYLSTAPFVDGDNFKYRWVVGIGRAF